MGVQLMCFIMKDDCLQLLH